MTNELMISSLKTEKNGFEFDEEESEGFDFTKMLVLKQESPLLIVFKPINIVACMLQSYVYVWFAAFSDDGRTTLMIVLESLFVFDMLLNFLTEFYQDGEIEPVRDLARISKRYLKAGFVSDLIPLLPLPFIVGAHTLPGRLLYLLKLFRLKRGLDAFDVGVAISMIKFKIQKRTERIIKANPSIGDDKDNDHNNIEGIMVAGYFLKTLKLVIIILNFSYFLGLIWLIFCEITETRDKLRKIDAQGNPTWEADDYFREKFELNSIYTYMEDSAADYRSAVVVTYYAFTSLSTVGFGDYHPRSDNERLFIAFVLLCGVSIFSFIMGNFIAILNQFK